MNAICRALELLSFPSKNSSTIASIFEWKLTVTNHSKAHQVFTCFRIDPSINRTFPVEAVALWGNSKPNKEYYLQMTGSQDVLFWYERTIISRQFFINLIRRKYFRIQVSMNTGSDLKCDASSSKCKVRYRVFQDFESPSSLNLCHCKQLRFPDYGLFNSTILRD